MKNINRVCLSGNMTRDPELRRTQSGMAILTIGVACNDSKKNPQTGQWEDIANFIDCTMFGNRAESIVNYLHKGTKVFIEGKFRQSTWQDKETGKNRSKIEVLIDEIEFNNPNNGQQQGGSQQPQYAPQQSQQPPMQQGYYAPPQAAPQQPMQPQMAQPAPQYQQPQPAPQAAPQPAQQAQPAQQQMQYDASVYDDDIPF